nr:uncharacterized transporter HI_0883-like [Nerophis lumbriciformis]
MLAMIESLISVLVIVTLLTVTMLAIYLRGLPLRSIGLAWQSLCGRFDGGSATGETSAGQALVTSLASSVGLGNIIGVVVALAVGGPGAIVWMVVCSVLLSQVKFLECAAGATFRRVEVDHSVSAGPMIYLPVGLSGLGRAKLGKRLGTVYAVLALPSILQWFQVNQAHQAINAAGFAIDPLAFGLIFALLTGIVIAFELRSVIRTCQLITPLMIVGYLMLLGCMLVTFSTQLIGAMQLILSDALAPTSMAGGLTGAIVLSFRRSLYSSEAGLGSASAIHGRVRTKQPTSQGLVAQLEPIIDVGLAALAALAIVASGVTLQADHAASSMSQAVTLTSPSYGPLALAIIVVFFAYSTVIGYSIYCQQVPCFPLVKPWWSWI